MCSTQTNDFISVAPHKHRGAVRLRSHAAQSGNDMPHALRALSPVAQTADSTSTPSAQMEPALAVESATAGRLVDDQLPTVLHDGFSQSSAPPSRKALVATARQQAVAHRKQRRPLPPTAANFHARTVDVILAELGASKEQFAWFTEHFSVKAGEMTLFARPTHRQDIEAARQSGKLASFSGVPVFVSYEPPSHITVVRGPRDAEYL
jgi:hypothetical protein